MLEAEVEEPRGAIIESDVILSEAKDLDCPGRGALSRDDEDPSADASG
jgi:hypothetical protein